MHKTYIIPLQIWMIFFNAIIKNGDNHPLTSVSVVPCWYNIHVEATATILYHNRQQNHSLASLANTFTSFFQNKVYTISLKLSV